MTYYNVLLVQLFISVAICSRIELLNSDTPRFKNRVNNLVRTSTEVPSDDSTTKNKVDLKIYYETLCPASMDFFVSQLSPAVIKLGSYLDIHLVPYGNAQTFPSQSKIYTFSCQHGEPECYGNMVQACAINVLRNNTHAVLFNSCIMKYTSSHDDYSYFVSVLTWCGYAENVVLKDVWECMSSRRGAILLKKYGDVTNALSPRFVPYLVIDGSTKYQDEATNNLIATICRMLSPKPLACIDEYNTYV